jgi:hypothetical protein
MASDFEPGKFVRVEALSLEQIFRERGHFWLPWYQRSYAWRDDNVKRLISDLLSAFRSPEQRYFLGYVSTATRDRINGSAIADGQQRLVTLSLLFAELRSRLEPGVVRDALGACLIRSSNEPVIALQRNLRDVHLDLITSDLEPAEERTVATDLSPPEQSLVLNRHAIAEMLDEAELAETNDVESFARFCLTRCVIILQTVDREDEALQMLATEEETGLPFHSIERTKVTLISIMPRADQEEASEIWDRMHATLGADGLAQVLNLVRILKAGKTWRGASKTPVETELAQQYNFDRNGLEFLKTVALPAMDAFVLLGSAADDRTPLPPIAGNPKLLAALTKLNWLDHPHWQVPALAWLVRFGTDAPETVAFFEALDRHAWAHRIANGDQKTTSTEFARLAAAIENAKTATGVAQFRVTKKIAKAVRTNLAAHTFFRKHYAVLVLRRLSLLLEADSGPRDNERISCEHILPRNPDADSQWRTDFGDANVSKAFCDQIGNLCYLTPEENRQAGNADWDIKRPILERSKLALAKEAAAYESWTKATVRKRSEKLIKLIRDDLGI